MFCDIKNNKVINYKYSIEDFKMSQFYTQYYYKDTGNYIQTLEEFNNLRVGSKIVRNTGDEYIKVDANTFNKVNRTFMSKEESDQRYAQLNSENTFTEPQTITAEITEDNHVITKKYLDDTFNTKLDGYEYFARTDQGNVFELNQSCALEPTSRAHLVNKAYVDDLVDTINTDTSNYARLDRPNTFNELQSCSIEPNNPFNLVNKSYVDLKTGAITSDLANVAFTNKQNNFTEDQTFDHQVLILSTPLQDQSAIPKSYLEGELQKVYDLHPNFAKLDSQNTFIADNTFQGKILNDVVIEFDSQVVNKLYVDSLLEDYAKLDRVNTFTQYQKLDLEPIEPNDLANKSYIDSRTQDASTDIKGIVQLSPNIEEAQLNSKKVPTDYQVLEFVSGQINSQLSSYVTIYGDQEIYGLKKFSNIGFSLYNFGKDLELGTYKITNYSEANGNISYIDVNGLTIASVGFYANSVEVPPPEPEEPLPPETENLNDSTTEPEEPTFTIKNYGYNITVFKDDYNFETSEGTKASIDIGFNQSGEIITSAPTPKITSNDTSIATTEFVNTKIQESAIILRTWS